MTPYTRGMNSGIGMEGRRPVVWDCERRSRWQEPQSGLVHPIAVADNRGTIRRGGTWGGFCGPGAAKLFRPVKTCVRMRVIRGSNRKAGICLRRAAVSEPWTWSDTLTPPATVGRQRRIGRLRGVLGRFFGPRGDTGPAAPIIGNGYGWLFLPVGFSPPRVRKNPFWRAFPGEEKTRKPWHVHCTIPFGAPLKTSRSTYRTE